MSKDARYRKEIATARWRALTLKMKTDAMWRCEVCGVATQRLATHHIQPVEGIRDDDAFRAKFYDPRNLQVLCYQCHKEVHDAMGSRGREGHQRLEEQKRKNAEERIKLITIPNL